MKSSKATKKERESKGEKEERKEEGKKLFCKSIILNQKKESWHRNFMKELFCFVSFCLQITFAYMQRAIYIPLKIWLLCFTQNN